jgi:hypothetical protein
VLVHRRHTHRDLVQVVLAEEHGAGPAKLFRDGGVGLRRETLAEGLRSGRREHSAGEYKVLDGEGTPASAPCRALAASTIAFGLRMMNALRPGSSASMRAR